MSLLDEIIAKLDGMPADALAVLAEKKATVAARKWTPSPGPQTDAYLSPADILLYGGQAAGGKTDLSLGLAFTEHKRSLIMRRKFANLGGLTERAIAINGSRTGFNGSSPPLLRTDDGRYIQFAGCQHLGDEQDWQGIPFDLKCVGKGTPVVMGDGTRKAIETLRVGDMVATLEGPRRVNRVLPVRRDQAARVYLYDEAGAFVCSQDQSLTHEVLTPSGWVALGTFDAACQPSTCAPTEYRAERRLSGWCVCPSAMRSRHGAGRSVGLPRMRAALQDWLALTGLMARVACAAPPHPDSAGAVSCASRQGLRPLRGWCDRPVRSSPLHGSVARHTSRRNTFSLRGCGAGSWSALRDWLGRCSFGSHQDGGRARRLSDRGFDGVGVLSCLQLPADAGRPNPICSAVGGLGRTPTHSHHTGTYCHPYTNETRRVAQGSSVRPVSFTYSAIGVIDLYDIEVDEVNHYITEGGIVNRNCFDEATQFLEQQVRFHLGWLRQSDGEQGQRTRAILATNPPVSADGDWIIGFFRPWLDITHPRPAKPGDLRWYVTAEDGSDIELGPDDVGRDPRGRPVHKTLTNRDGKPLFAVSRSFIPARLSDNPFLVDTNYGAQLDGLPEPLRSAVRDGNFMAARADAEFQLIPTDWVIAAQDRWQPNGGKDVAMTAMAFDPAGGGKDAAELSWRHGGWYGELVTVTGPETVDGSAAAARIFQHRRDAAPVIVDVGGGFGGSVLLRLKDNSAPTIGFNGANKGVGQTADGSKLQFVNKRAEAWWRFREALDPRQFGGSAIALPPDPELRSDLTAPTYSVEARGVQIESKEDLRKRLGRSPGKGDCVVMCFSEGNAAVRRTLNRGVPGTDRPTHATVGYSNLKRRR